MANPDILLKQNRISVVGADGPEETNGTERGDLEITTGKGDPATIKLNADRANLTLGDGEDDFVQVDGNNAEVEIRDVTGDAQARLNNTGLMLSEFTGEPGTAVMAPIIDPETRDTIRLFGNSAAADIGNNFQSGTVNLYRSGSTDSSDGFFHKTIALDGDEAKATLGGSDRGGRVILTDSNDNDRVTLDANKGELRLYGRPPGSGTDAPEITLEAGQNRAKAYIGGFDRSGQITLAKQSSGNDLSIPIDLDAEHARASVGGDGTDGVVKTTDSSGSTTAELQGGDGNVVAGGDGTEGTVLLRHTDGNGNSVNYRLTATQQGLVFSTMRSPSGSGSTTSQQEALRIDPDGTVRVKGGSVQSL